MLTKHYVWESIGIAIGAGGCICSVWLMMHKVTALWVAMFGLVGGAYWVVRGVKQLVRTGAPKPAGFEVKLTGSPVTEKNENDHG